LNGRTFLAWNMPSRESHRQSTAALPAREVTGRQPQWLVRPRKVLSLCDRNDAITTVSECPERARRVGATRQPEMLFECVARNGAFDLAAANRQRENHGAPIRRDSGCAIRNFHTCLNIIVRGLLYWCYAAQQSIYQKSAVAQSTTEEPFGFHVP
jgi:hypothetical protein